MAATRRLAAPALAAIGVALIAVSTAGQTPPAQPQTPSKAVVMKGKAPVSDAVLDLALPRPAEADLPNGLHLMVLEDRRAPQVNFVLVFPGAGGYADPADHHGLAMFTAAMLREGTSTRSSRQIAEQLERLSAVLSVNAGMAEDEARVTGFSLSEHVGTLLDLAADIVLNPVFPEEELARYKTRTGAQLTQLRANPGFLAAELFNRVTYGDHPAGRTMPAPAALEATTRQALVDFHKARYVPDHAALAIAGDISMAEVRALVDARFGAWKKAGVSAPAVADPAALSGPGVYLVERPNSVQTNLLVGTQAISRTDPDYFALTVLNRVIGGGPTGRLFRHLREEKGYTYGAYSNLSAARHRGDWSASTQVRTEVTEPALTDLMDEIRQVREVPVPEQEFLDAKRSLVASFALELESPARVLANHIDRWRYRLPADYWDRYPAGIMGVTRERAQAMAKKYLDPSRLQIVAVGTAAQIESTLKKFGAVQAYDTEGKRISGSQ